MPMTPAPSLPVATGYAAIAVEQEGVGPPGNRRKQHRQHLPEIELAPPPPSPHLGKRCLRRRSWRRGRVYSDQRWIRRPCSSFGSEAREGEDGGDVEDDEDLSFLEQPTMILIRINRSEKLLSLKAKAKSASVDVVTVPANSDPIILLSAISDAHSGGDAHVFRRTLHIRSRFN